MNQSENTASQTETSHRFFELSRRLSINFQNIFQLIKQDDEYYFRVANDILRKRQQIATTSQTQFIVSKMFETQHASIFTFSTTTTQSSNTQRMITSTTTKKQHVSSEITMITSSTTIKSSDIQQMITQSIFTSTKNQRALSKITIMNIRRTIKTSTLKNQKKLTSRKFSWQHRIHHFVAEFNFVFDEKSIVKFSTLFKSKNFAHYDLYNDFNEIFYNIKNIAIKLSSRIVLNDFHAWQILKENIVAKTKKKIWFADFTLRNIILDIRKNRNRATKYMNSKKIWKYHHERDYVFLKNEKMFHNRHKANSCFRQKDVANNDSVIKNFHMKKKIIDDSI